MDFKIKQRHAHGEDGGTLNQDGSIHDSDPGFGRKTMQWLRDDGWSFWGGDMKKFNHAFEKLIE